MQVLRSSFRYIEFIQKVFKFAPHETLTNEGKSYERYRRILLTGLSTGILKILSALINVITLPLTVHYLGSERYGLWMSITSVLTLLSFSDLGLGNGLLNAISQAKGKNNLNEARIAVSSTFFLLCFIAGVLFLIFVLIYPLISWAEVFNVDTTIARKEVGPTMFIIVMFFLINLPLGVIQRINEGLQEGFKYQLWLIVGSLISLGTLLISIKFNSSLPFLVFAFSLGQIISTLLCGFFLFKVSHKELFPKIIYFNWTLGKQLINSGLIFFLLVVFSLLANASDNIIISQVLGPEKVAGYEIVRKMFFFSMITAYVIQPLWPAFGEAIASGDFLWAKRTLNKALKLSIISSIIISLPLLLFGKQIISLWIGDEYIPDWILLIGYYLYIILNNYIGITSTLINSNPIVKKIVIPIALTAIFGVILKIYLSTLLGVGGIIWATLVSWSLFYAIPSYYISKQIFVSSKL